jgi:hypothetical protein
MIKNICVRSAAFLALFGAGVAMAQTAEVEPNDTPATAQRLPSGGAAGVTVQGEILTASDIDYYAFHAQAGDVLSINIDNGMKTPDLGLHSTVAVLGPTGGTVLSLLNVAVKGQTDGGSPFVRPGTRDTTWDAKLPTVPIPVSGTYVVAVAGYPTFVSQNGFVAKAGTGIADGNSIGTYTLIITGANPDPLKIIGIDIKPGDQRLTTPINMRSNGRIPVALLSAPDFDPFLVKQESLRFGHEGTEMSLARCSKDKDDDYNKDGKPDLVCQFYTQSTLFVPTDIEGVLSGEMLDGTKIEGRAPLKVIPADMRHHGDRDGDHDRDHDGKGEHEKEEHSKGRR